MNEGRFLRASVACTLEEPKRKILTARATLGVGEESGIQVFRKLIPIFRRRRLYIVLGLLVVAGSPIAYYYFQGYTSVISVKLSLELEIFRSRATNNSSIAFHIPAMVWSRLAPLDIDVSSPTFSLEPDSITIGSVAPVGAIIHQHHCLVFPLIFQTSDESVAKTLAGRQSNNMLLTMSAHLSSGVFKQAITEAVSERVYDAPISIDSYACLLDVLPQSSNI